MGQSIYFSDPVVAAAYHAHPGEWAYVAENAEALWLLANKHGYSLKHPTAVPAPPYVHPDAPLPFVPFPDLNPPGTQPALMTVTVDAFGDTFTVTFGGQVDTVDATGRFVVLDTEGVIVASGTYAQPAGTTFDAAAGLLEAALAPFAAAVAVVKTGPALELTGVGLTMLGAVAVRLTIPRVAAQPAPSPSPTPTPAPSPTPSPTPAPTPTPVPAPTSLQIGPEDQHVAIDTDGDGKADVHVVVDNPPKSTP